VEGLIYALPEEKQGIPLPTSFGDALEALEADPVIVEAMGAELVETFKVIKGAELDRYRTWVTDWEFAEYSPRL
jgi:glutamine synthetase